MRVTRAAVLIALVCATASGAQAACSPAITADDRATQSRAQTTVPLMLRNAFDADGKETVGLALIVELPRTIAPDCAPSRETVFNVQKDSDLVLRGTVLTNFLSENTALFMQEITFSPDAILDWSFNDFSSFPVVQYRLYSQRPVTEDGRMLYNLTEQAVPDNWN
ncbi:hypothetical protein L0666_05190 [Octadecabacter sp. CECT 8868]|uniref:hypothetical protein n=1 Tax=Octadecabacter algicola TaxID=2909342 RepID=UPI001F29484D|nr:hypothetical protein [Octadecabacter algicola]MCF2904373.1 hypothetical protein [Octadecabacter algicola]